MDINELLRSLHSLFSHVARLDLQKRIETWKQQPGNNQPQDIAAPLSDYIDKLATSHSAASSTAGEADHASTAQPVPGETSSSTQKASVVNGFSTNLSEYLKSHPMHSDSDIYLGEKLRASTWSHIHTALLKARQGDVKAARVHADIANQAMKEAAHYLSEETFRQFADEIARALEELKSELH
ncbi:MAG: hypothetical protein EP315_02670 [Gammaproteobacteria bacterium]|nr:MAG: hypothetical protein EP315_02670 [Gammaproteobacteria bacterium]